MNKSNEQKTDSKSNSQSHNKNTTVSPKDGSQGPGKVARQEHQGSGKDSAKTPSRAAKNDDGDQRQESRKS